ncbi:MAG: FtsX-like permease family protein [Candidatus Thorarchaeota archaeon]
MAARLSSLIAFFHVNLIHWYGARRRIILSLIFTTLIVSLAFSMFAVRESNLNDLLVYYENKNPLGANGSPTIRFSTEIDYSGFPSNYGESISQYINGFLYEADLEPVVAETHLAFSVHFEQFAVPGFRRATSATIGALPNEIFEKLGLALTGGRSPTNSSEVVDIGLFERLNLQYSPISDNNNLTAFSFQENQTFSVVGQTDEETFVHSLALFSSDLTEQSANWDLITSIDYLIEFCNRFTFFHSLIYGYIEVEWHVEAITGNHQTWKNRARDFESRIEGVKPFLGSSMRFTPNDELSRLLSSFKDEKEHFDLTYALLSLPLFVLVLLVLLEVNGLGNESQSREIELLSINGVGLLETFSIFAIERIAVSVISAALGIIFAPFFILLAQIFDLPGASSISFRSTYPEALSIEICAIIIGLVFLTSIPSILSSLRRSETIGITLKEKKQALHKSFIILLTVICLGIVLLLFSVIVLDLPRNEAQGSDAIFVGEHLKFGAFSIFFLAAPPLIIRAFNSLSGRIGSRLWKSHRHKSTLPFQLFREEAHFLARPALILLLTLMLLVPSLVVTPSINAHLDEESQLVAGSTLIVENWVETFPLEAVYNVSSAIETASIVRHIFLDGRFPPLKEKLSFLVIDPTNFSNLPSLELDSTGSLASRESIQQLTSNGTTLVGAGCSANLEKGDSISFKTWEPTEEENFTHYVPHEAEFRILDFIDLFPLLTVLTRTLADVEELDRNLIDELVMSHGSWNILSNLISLDSSNEILASRTGLMVELNDPSMQDQVAGKLQETFGRSVRSLNDIKQSLESPFHESYIIIGTTSLLIAVIAVLIMSSSSANALLNRRRDGFEVLIRKGMTRKRVTLQAAQEFGLAIALPAILGIAIGFLYLFSMEGILSIHENLLPFHWLLNPFELWLAAIAVIFSVYMVWVCTFFAVISRAHFMTGR